MAKFDHIDMGYEPDEYVVQRDDGSCYKRFNNFSEAQSYYNYLQQLDDQKRTVAQNDEILANQRRLLDAQERNSRILQRTPVSSIPPASRQILDPEYKEWIQFQKETSPEYKKWKREKEAEAERIRKLQEEEAERQRINIEIQERKRKEQEIKRKQKQEEELKENQRIIEPLVSSLLQRKKLSWEQRCQIAKYTNNKLAIKRLTYDNSINVLDALLTNPYIDSATIQHIHKRKKDKIDSKNELQTIRSESKENSGCLKSLITILFIAVSINLLIYFIASKL